VLLAQGKEEPGKPELTARHGRFAYVFTTAATRDQFLKDPERWGIQLGGACARMGDPVRGNADSYHVHEGRIYVFGSDACYRLFKENPKRFLLEPDVWKPESSALARGAAMLAEIRRAMGVEGMSGWKEVRKTGGTANERSLTATLPFSIEAEMKNARFSFRHSIQGEKVEMISTMQGMSNTLAGGAAKATRASYARDLLWLVSGSFEAVPGSTPGTVDVFSGAEIVTLHLDLSSKRPVAAQWKGRGNDAEVTVIRATYSDYRDVEGGGKVPFQGQVSAGGTAIPAQSWVLESVSILRKTAGASGSWPQWGGPRRDFHVDAANVRPWTGNTLQKAWSRKLGDGYSGIVSDGQQRLFTMYREGSDEVVLAASSVTGETIWEKRYAAPVLDGFEADQGPGPRATPLVDGDLVFTAGVTGIVHALRRDTGAVQWTLDLRKEFGAPIRARGYSVSPLSFKDSIILLAGGKGSAIVRLAKQNGKVIWKARDEQIAYASPFLMPVTGRTAPVLVALMAREILGLDPETGALLWSHPHSNTELVNASTPVAGDDGLLFLSSAYDGGCRALQVEPGGDRVRELWSHRLLRIHHANAVRLGTTVFGSSGDFGPSPLTALDIKTGKVLWRDRSIGRSNILAVDQTRMLLLDEEGVLVLAEPGDAGVKILAKANVQEGLSWTAPTLSGSRIYVRNRVSMTAYELPGLSQQSALARR
jgi:outer membrane protein assembly factor BamB/YHS domain-containing protein